MNPSHITGSDSAASIPISHHALNISDFSSFRNPRLGELVDVRQPVLIVGKGRVGLLAVARFARPASTSGLSAPRKCPTFLSDLMADGVADLEVSYDTITGTLLIASIGART